MAFRHLVSKSYRQHIFISGRNLSEPLSVSAHRLAKFVYQVFRPYESKRVLFLIKKSITSGQTVIFVQDAQHKIINSIFCSFVGISMVLAVEFCSFCLSDCH